MCAGGSYTLAEESLADYARLSERGKWLALDQLVLGIVFLITGFRQVDSWRSPR